MRRTFKTILSLLLVGFTTLGCEEANLLEQDQNTPAMDVKTYENLEFIYQVTDMEGNPQSTFREGENFMFSFVVKNHGDEDISLGAWDFPVVIDGFFAVYRKGNMGDGKQRIGKPFTSGGNTRDLLWQPVPKKEEIEYRMPWLTQKDTSYVMPIYRPEKPNSHDRNYLAVEQLPEPLPSGEYYSGFTLEYKEEEIRFAITFSIE